MIRGKKCFGIYSLGLYVIKFMVYNVIIRKRIIRLCIYFDENI